MDTLLRRYVEWKGRRKAAQIIVFDGAAEIATTRAFLKGTLSGIGAAFLLFAITAPATVDAALLEEVDRRRELIREANQRTEQAAGLVESCLATARGMEETVASYRQMLGVQPGVSGTR